MVNAKPRGVRPTRAPVLPGDIVSPILREGRAC